MTYVKLDVKSCRPSVVAAGAALERNPRTVGRRPATHRWLQRRRVLEWLLVAPARPGGPGWRPGRCVVHQPDPVHGHRFRTRGPGRPAHPGRAVERVELAAPGHAEPLTRPALVRLGRQPR